jgi:hypothetical protein
MSNDRLVREKKTIECMVSIFCTQNHMQKESLCEKCKGLLEYSISRLSKCVLKAHKPVCFRCKLHCYKGDMRNQIRQVMRYSGKRMIWSHPLLTIRHIVDLIS